MTAGAVDIIELVDSGDLRGCSYGAEPGDGVPFPLRHVHATTLHPGHVRGNHFHKERLELLLVTYSGGWTLYWDGGVGTSSQSRMFDGVGAVLVRVRPLASHAIVNDSAAVLHVVALSDVAYDASAPDTYPRAVAPR